VSQSIPVQYPPIMPYLTVCDCQKAIDFYKQALGFALMDEPIRDDNGVVVHAEMSYNNGVVMFGAENAFNNPAKAPITSGVCSPVGLYVYCDDVDKHCEQAKVHGAQITQEPTDMFWGDRMYSVTDPDGHSWKFATPLSTSAK
jgi:PhnB protein